MKESLLFGALLGIGAAIAFTGMNVFVKLIGDSLPVYELVLARFFVSLILLLPIVFTSKDFSFKLEKPFKFLLRTLSTLLALVCLFAAVQKMPLALALLLANTTPLMLPILAFLIRGAKTTKWGVAGIVLGFMGVGVILNPQHTHLNWGALLALGSAFFAALAILQIRLLGKTMPTLSMLFYFFLLGSVLMSPFGLIKFVLPHSEKTILFLLLMGLSGFIYQICSTLSYKLAPVRLTTPILYLNVLLGGVCGWMIWGQSLSYTFIIGCLIIIGGVLITLFLGYPKGAVHV